MLNLSTETGNIGYNTIVGTSDTSSVLGQILELLPQLTNSKIVLDSGVLVGETAPLMNNALGTLYGREQRSV